MVQRMDQTGLILGQQTGIFLYRAQHGSQNVYHLNLQFHRPVGKMLAQARVYDCIADDSLVTRRFLQRIVNLFLVVDIGDPDYIKFGFRKLADCSLDNRFRRTADRI